MAGREVFVVLSVVALYLVKWYTVNQIGPFFRPFLQALSSGPAKRL